MIYGKPDNAKNALFVVVDQKDNVVTVFQGFYPAAYYVDKHRGMDILCVTLEMLRPRFNKKSHRHSIEINPSKIKKQLKAEAEKDKQETEGGVFTMLWGKDGLDK